MSRRRKKIVTILGILAVIVLILFLLLMRWGQEHVLEMTGDKRWAPNCIACHMGAGVKPSIGARPVAAYRSPRAIAVSDDGKTLYVTGEGCDKLLIVDAAQRKLVGEAPVGPRPHGVCLSVDGKQAFVSNRWSNTVSVVDLASRQAVRTFEVGDGPAGVALSADGSALFVANSLSNDISVVETATGEEIRRLSAGRSPFAMALSADRSRLFVGSRLSSAVPFRTEPMSELTVVDTRRKLVVDRRMFINANMMEGVAVAPSAAGRGSGSVVLASYVRPKNLVPGVQVARGWMMTSGLGVVHVESSGAGGTSDSAPSQVTLDDLNSFYADPSDVVVTPDGRWAYVSHSGADIVSVIDLAKMRDVLRREEEAARKSRRGAWVAPANNLRLSREFVVARIKTAPCPTGLAVSPDGANLYVAAQLDDRIQVISTVRNVIVGSINLEGPRHVTLRRKGERIFKNAGNTFQGQFSCRSCHPDGHVDALTYELESNGVGTNFVDNRTLQQIDGTAPFKWNGVSPSLYRQCGMRFAAFITRADPYTPEQINALVAHIMSIPLYPNAHRKPGQPLTDEQAKGKAIFERTKDKKGNPIAPRDRCVTCHRPPLFTDHKKHDVDTAASTDTRRDFDTAHLTNIYQTAPYLHDGRAQTLEEIWTIHGTTEKHGIVNDLMKYELNYLIRYLETL